MKEKLSPFQVSVLIYMIQSGIVLFSLPRLAAETFGTNGWLGILIIYMIVNINLILIWLVFKYGDGRSMFEILSHLPKWVTIPLSFFLASIWIPLGTMVMLKFFMLLKMLLYPNVSVLFFIIMAYVFAYPLLTNGIYHIAKSTVILFYFTIWTIFLLLFHIYDFSFIRLTPFIFQGDKDLIKGGASLYTSMLGYELTILFLNYVQEKRLRALVIGNTITTLVYLGVCFISFGFFSFEQLLKDMYPVVTLLEYIKFPVLERVENFIFSLFGLKVLVTTVMYFWGSIEVMKYQFTKVKPHYLLIAILIVSFLASVIPKRMSDVNQWLEYLAFVATGIAFLLPVFLLIILVFIKKSIQKEETK